MNVAILTFDAFNELDSILAASLLNRLVPEGVNAYITAPTAQVTSKNGLTVTAQRPLGFANEADAVIIGSGLQSARIAADPTIRDALRLDPLRQLIVSQCSGAFLLAALGLVEAGRPICTDLTSAPEIRALGFTTPGKPFHAEGAVASAGGCLSSQYAAAWIAGRFLGLEAMERMIWGAAPVGEKEAWVDRTLAAVHPFLRLPVAA